MKFHTSSYLCSFGRSLIATIARSTTLKDFRIFLSEEDDHKFVEVFLLVEDGAYGGKAHENLLPL